MAENVWGALRPGGATVRAGGDGGGVGRWPEVTAVAWARSDGGTRHRYETSGAERLGRPSRGPHAALLFAGVASPHHDGCAADLKAA